MADRKSSLTSAMTAPGGEGSVDSLSKTLEELEARLKRMQTSRQQARSAPATTPDLSQAVFQIAGRRAVLEETAPPAARPAEAAASSVAPAKSARVTSSQDVLAQGAKASVAMPTGARPTPVEIARRRAVPEGWGDEEHEGERQRPQPARGRSEVDAEIARLEEMLKDIAAAGGSRADIEALRTELFELRGLMGGTAREDTLDLVGKRWETLADRLDTRAVEDTQARRALSEQLESLKISLGSLASERSVRAVEERWSQLEDRFAKSQIEERVSAMGDRLAELEIALSKLPETLALKPLEERVDALAAGIEAIAVRFDAEDENEDGHFIQIEERLDEISRAILSVANTALSVDMTPVDRVEARLQALAARVDEMAKNNDLAEIQKQLADFAGRLESLADSPAPQLVARMERFSAQLEEHLAACVTQDDFDERFMALNARMDEASAPRIDDARMNDLNEQLARIAAQIEAVGQSRSDPELEVRLTEIERQIAENREDIAAVARCAADEAIQRMLETGDFRYGQHVTQLSEDLRALEALSRESDAQAQDYFEAVHQTLSRLVRRIDDLEREIVSTRDAQAADPAPHVRVQADEARAPESPRTVRGLRQRLKDTLATPFAPGAEKNADNEKTLDHAADAPSLDASDAIEATEDDKPLAIGSGAPNITALVDEVRRRQSGQAPATDDSGRSDFIAAARRAAVAAAAEAENLRERPEHQAGGAESDASPRSRRRGKPVMMAIGAVLLALLAIPTTQAVLGSKDAGTDLAATSPTALDIETAALSQDREVPTVDAAERVAAMSELVSPAAMGPGLTTSDAPKTGVVGPSAKTGTMLHPEQIVIQDEEISTASLERRNIVQAGEEARGMAQAPVEAATPAIELPEGIANAALTQAVENNNPVALFEVGLRLMEGRNGAPEPAAAAEWFELSAAQDFAPAQYSLGTLYEKGNGVELDAIAARDWYLEAANNGNVRAMHNLAVLYATGLDGKSEPREAARWFEEAANHGMTDSQYNLGILYARGAGVEQSLVNSYKWFSIVAEAGDADAGRKRDEIAEALSAEDLADAKQRAEAFEPRPQSVAANTVDVPEAWADTEEKPLETSSVDMKRAIQNVQAILGQLGYDAGTPDGIVGERTVSAIRAFQLEAGLQPTGAVDERLIRALLDRAES